MSGEIIPKYPSEIDDNSSLIEVRDNASTVLVRPVSDIDLVLTVESTHSFPSSGYITVEGEIIRYSSKTDTQFIVATRGAQQTVPTPHNSGVNVVLNVLAVHHNILKDAIIRIETELGTQVKGLYSNLKERIEKLLHDYLIHEDITDKVTGSTTDFITKFPFYSGTVKVWINGLKERGIVEVGDKLIRIIPPPEIGDSLEIEYIRKPD